jgi:hypothetical protein
VAFRRTARDHRKGTHTNIAKSPAAQGSWVELSIRFYARGAGPGSQLFHLSPASAWSEPCNRGSLPWVNRDISLRSLRMPGQQLPDHLIIPVIGSPVIGDSDSHPSPHASGPFSSHWGDCLEAALIHCSWGIGSRSATCHHRQATSHARNTDSHPAFRRNTQSLLHPSVVSIINVATIPPNHIPKSLMHHLTKLPKQ